jgi:hypothetical protein
MRTKTASAGRSDFYGGFGPNHCAPSRQRDCSSKFDTMQTLPLRNFARRLRLAALIQINDSQATPWNLKYERKPLVELLKAKGWHLADAR